MIVKCKVRKAITAPQTVAAVLKAVLSHDCEVDQSKEHFWAVGLNTRNCIEYVELVSLGTLNASLVHPREVYRTAIGKAVASVILGHNHPSGDPEPSQEDLKITKRLVEAGKIIGIDVIDHVIIGSGASFLSMKERGLI
jgi:DNA repair protein RadC